MALTLQMQDFKYAVRSLTKAPGFTLVAVLTVALGIGANTAIFTLVNALLLRPLPYAEPNRLVMVWQDLRGRGGPADEWATPGNVADWRAESGLFDKLAAISGWNGTLGGVAEAEMIPGEQVTYEYFDVLGVRPALGRGFTAADDVPNAKRVVVISDGLWKRRFGGRPGAIGETMTLTGIPHEIVGVMPAGFRPIVAARAEMWRPIQLNMANPSRGAIFLRVVARLPDGVPLERAQAQATALATRLEAQYPNFNEKTDFSLQPLHDRVTGQIRPGLLALLGAVGFVLLIACANIANLLMARGSRRGRELAVRSALGAGRWMLVRQLLTESLVLAALGGAAGLMAGVWAVDALVAIAPANAPRLSEISLDPTVFAFAAVLTLVTGTLFGLAPALQHARVDVTHALKDGARGSSAAGGNGLRRALIVAEVALALVLVTGGGLLIQTFNRLQTADLGFRTSDVLVAGYSVPSVSYPTPPSTVAFHDRVLEKAAAIPGVEQAALTSILPLAPGDNDVGFFIEGRPAPQSQSEQPVTWYRMVSSNYLDTIGMRLVRGRHFEPREAAPAAIVNETLVRKYFPGEDPLGRILRFGSGADAPRLTIVGVVADARADGARAETSVETFVPYWQVPQRGMSIVLRGRNATQFAPALRESMASLDRSIPLVNVREMSDILSESIGESRFLATLSGGFALLALVLASVGIYGVMAYSVSQRTAELGVRMALGASAREVFRLVIGDGLRLAGFGVALGLAGSLVVGRWLTTLLFGVEPRDVTTLAVTAGVLLTVSAIASFIPAWRASRVDPMVALRAD